MLAVSWADDFRTACVIEAIAEITPDAASAIAGVGGQAAESHVRQWISRREAQIALLVEMANSAVQNCRGAGPTLAKHLVLIQLELSSYREVRELIDSTPPLRRIFQDNRSAEVNFFQAMSLIIAAFGSPTS